MLRPAPPRSRAQRKGEALAKLAAGEADVWVWSASVDRAVASPYMVPLSLSWIEDRIVVALSATSRTARNIGDCGVARLALGSTRDVVMIDVALDRSVLVGDDDGLVERYAAQAGWDPRTAESGYVLLVLRPLRIQAWREENELEDRTLMRDGHWLV
jgi:hypothetical protein